MAIVDINKEMADQMAAEIGSLQYRYAKLKLVMQKNRLKVIVGGKESMQANEHQVWTI